MAKWPAAVGLLVAGTLLMSVGGMCKNDVFFGVDNCRSAGVAMLLYGVPLVWLGLTRTVSLRLDSGGWLLRTLARLELQASAYLALGVLWFIVGILCLCVQPARRPPSRRRRRPAPPAVSFARASGPRGYSRGVSAESD